MALYQPTQIVPSSLSGFGDGVVDVTNPLTVSWQVNGFSPLVAYQIVIYQNDTDSTQMLDTGKVTLSEPFYGTNAEGEQVLFEADEITAAEMSTAGIVNGYANGYKLIITQWWGATDAESITQTSASVFITRATPTVSINAIASPVTTKEITATATYTQAQGDMLSWVRWILKDSAGNALKDTGKLYTGLLSFHYDGLFSGSSYDLECLIETENGVQATSGETTFSVSYTMINAGGIVNACRRAGQPYVELMWSDRSQINGEASGQYQIAGGILRLPQSSSVVWDHIGEFDLAFAPEWSLAWRGIIPSPNSNGFDAVVIDFDDNTSLVINVKNTAVAAKIGSTTLFSQALSMRPNDILVVVMTKSNWYLKQVTYSGGLYPLTDLYPSTTLYPSPSTRIINNWTGSLSYTQETVSGITLNGEQNCEYIWLYSGMFSTSMINNMVGSEWYEPSYDANTYFIATFVNNDLVADVSGATGDTPYGASVYRREGTNENIEWVADVGAGYVVARDYGCKSNTRYTYYVYMRGENTYTTDPYISDPVQPSFNFYTLMECRQDSDSKGLYHVIQAFLVSGNLTQSAISNNNDPNLLSNFTRYPLRQPSPHNYKSGTLNTLIGAVDYGYNRYSDTWELADSLQALSLSQNALFLRDMKGAIWQIRTQGAVTVQVDDKSGAQPISMSFPWVEIGSAEGISIVALPGDSIWESDMVIDSTIYVEPESGLLKWNVPNNYQGTDLTLSSSGSLIAVGSGTIEMADLEIDEDMYLIATD